ncbi:MAG: nascent polypeptide-associated complex protein [Pyrobaculum sp.]
MIPTRDLEKFLKRMGIKMEEVEVAYVELRLKSGEVVKINNPTVSILKMPNRTLIYQIQASESSIQKMAQGGLTQGEYQPSDEDIALVMEQTGASREEVVKALVEARGDLVQATMRLLGRRH